MGIPVQIEVEATHVSGMINIYIFAWQMSFMLCVCHAPLAASPHTVGLSYVIFLHATLFLFFASLAMANL